MQQPFGLMELEMTATARPGSAGPSKVVLTHDRRGDAALLRLKALYEPDSVGALTHPIEARAVPAEGIDQTSF